MVNKSQQTYAHTHGIQPLRYRYTVFHIRFSVGTPPPLVIFMVPPHTIQVRLCSYHAHYLTTGNAGDMLEEVEGCRSLARVSPEKESEEVHHAGIQL